MKKRIFALALALCMMLSAMPTSFAGNGFLTLDNGEREPSQPSGILTPGDPVLPEEDLSGEPHLTLDDPAEGSQPAPDDPIDEPHLTLDDPVDEPEDRPAHQWRPAPFEEETFTQCDICGYLDGSHAGDCPVVNPPEEQAPAQSTIAEYKPAPMSAATYQDIYDSMMSAETLAEYKAELNALSADLQEAFFSLLTVEEREALSEREDSLAHDALTVTGAENATRTVTVEARASAFSFALHEALRQLGQDLIVSIYGRILESIDLPQNDYTMLETITPTDGARYQWQIQADDDLWVDIYNETGSIIRVSYAMVASLLDRYDAVQVRCEITGEDGVSYTDPVKVCVDYTSEDVYIDAEEEPIEPVILDEGKVEITQGQPVEPEAPAGPEEITEPEDTAEPATPAEPEDTTAPENTAAPEDTSAPENTAEPENTADPVAQSFSVTRLGGVYAQNFSVRQLTGGTENITYNVVINYVFENNAIAADPYTANLAAGSNFSATVTFPVIQGYLPYVDEVQQNSLELNYTAIDQDYTINVVYKPTNVNYTVIHYQQNLDDDNYTEKERETKQGRTNSTVPDVAKKYDGFYALLYETPAIAADGSTLVEVKYDRYYYLMNFDLDGGYGVEPIYARYGTSINVGEPEKPGYTFAGWDKELPKTMPAENSSFKANWTKGTSGFTVVFWYENADDENYSVAGTYKPADVIPGTQVSSGDYKDQDFEGRDDVHFAYNSAKAETVTVAGDGSTVLNVYYTRNTYTLTFKNAVQILTCTQPEHEHSNSCCKYGGTSLIHWWHSDSCCKLGLSEHTHKSKCYTSSDLKITAKYGADIHTNFPINTSDGKTILWDVPNGCTAFTPDTYLASINTMPGENITFTQNSQVSAATIWYYVEALNGATGTHTYNGKNFILYKSVKYTRVGYLTYAEEFHDIIGFKQWKSDPEFSSFDQNGKTSGIKENNYLYYTRNSYTLKFYNYNGYVTDKQASVQYQAPLNGYSFEPEYPSKLEANAYEFAGWYTTAGCYDGSEASLDTMTMPASDVVLYAKWVSKGLTVEFYLDKDALDAGTKLSTHPDITVPHGSLVKPTPADPENGSYTFVGWFYMENGVEKAFDFANMPVTKDMKVYGKWSSNVLKQYTIYYKIQGTDTEIAAPTTGSALAGVTKTFEAKGGTDLYADYQEGYFPVTKSHSMTLDINATGENDTNVYTFWYVEKPAVPYTVHYYKAGTTEKVHDDKVVSDNKKAVVTETFVPVNGMMPDAYQKRLVVSAKEGAVNEIIFYYTKDTTHAYYKITHYTENLATDAQGNTTWTEYASSQAVGDIGTTYTADPMTIPGFTYDSTVEDTVASGELTAEGLELKLYYTRNSYPYQVRYLEQGTGKQLADPKNDTGKYGQVISESAIDITNYDAVAPTSQTLNIRIEEGTEAKLNIITFYYKEKEATINYQVVGPAGSGTVTPTSETLKVLTGAAQGSTAAVTSNTYRFVGWYTDAACTTPVDAGWVDANNKLTPVKTDGTAWTAATYYAKFEYNVADLTITKRGWTEIDENQSFIFDVYHGTTLLTTVVIHGNSSAVIKNLTVGEQYTIIERETWSWRYQASYKEQTYTLKAPDEYNTVTFTNSRAKELWLNGCAAAKNIFGVFTGNKNGN